MDAEIQNLKLKRRIVDLEEIETLQRDNCSATVQSHKESFDLNINTEMSQRDSPQGAQLSNSSLQ